MINGLLLLYYMVDLTSIVGWNRRCGPGGVHGPQGAGDLARVALRARAGHLHTLRLRQWAPEGLQSCPVLSSPGEFTITSL